jgi:hypothetical protein
MPEVRQKTASNFQVGIEGPAAELRSKQDIRSAEETQNISNNASTRSLSDLT